jgi:hypothetical protein
LQAVLKAQLRPVKLQSHRFFLVAAFSYSPLSFWRFFRPNLILEKLLSTGQMSFFKKSKVGKLISAL